MSEPSETFVVGADESGHRLDAFLAARCPSYSRVQLRRAISDKLVTVDGHLAKPSYRLTEAQSVTLVFPSQQPTGPRPEAIELTVVYEDDDVAVIDKPPGMVVHPARGHWSGTLASALAHRFQGLSSVGGPTRPGIVHRLDRDTSGLILVAKNDTAHMQLAGQFERREVTKEYLAIVSPGPEQDRDWIEVPIGPHGTHREKMAVRRDHEAAREARTFFEVRERFRGMAWISAFPKTGRTHQIRVHMAWIGCPVLADRLYSGRNRITEGDLSGDRTDERVLLDRQALHAHRLEIHHPTTGVPLSWTSELPADMAAVLDAMRRHRRLAGS